MIKCHMNSMNNKEHEFTKRKDQGRYHAKTRHCLFVVDWLLMNKQRVFQIVWGVGECQEYSKGG